MHQKYHVAELS